MFAIREGRREDCHQLVQLYKELAEYQRLPSDRVVEPEVIEKDGFGDPSDRQFRTFVAHPNDNDKQLIGFALYYPKYSAWTGRGVWMEHLYVKPEHRGTGAGAALMARVAKQAVREGCTRFEWDCFDWNESSISFYKKFGAIVIMTGADVQTLVFRIDGNELRQLADRCVHK
jgi:GNAT superfamily N-acetyltransferase